MPGKEKRGQFDPFLKDGASGASVGDFLLLVDVLVASAEKSSETLVLGV